MSLLSKWWNTIIVLSRISSAVKKSAAPKRYVTVLMVLFVCFFAKTVFTASIFQSGLFKSGYAHFRAGRIEPCLTHWSALLEKSGEMPPRKQWQPWILANLMLLNRAGAVNFQKTSAAIFTFRNLFAKQCLFPELLLALDKKLAADPYTNHAARAALDREYLTKKNYAVFGLYRANGQHDFLTNPETNGALRRDVRGNSVDLAGLYKDRYGTIVARTSVYLKKGNYLLAFYSNSNTRFLVNGREAARHFNSRQHKLLTTVRLQTSGGWVEFRVISTRVFSCWEIGIDARALRRGRVVCQTAEARLPQAPIWLSPRRPYTVRFQKDTEWAAEDIPDRFHPVLDYFQGKTVLPFETVAPSWPTRPFDHDYLRFLSLRYHVRRARLFSAGHSLDMACDLGRYLKQKKYVPALPYYLKWSGTGVGELEKLIAIAPDYPPLITAVLDAYARAGFVEKAVHLENRHMDRLADNAHFLYHAYRRAGDHAPDQKRKHFKALMQKKLLLPGIDKERLEINKREGRYIAYKNQLAFISGGLEEWLKFKTLRKALAGDGQSPRMGVDTIEGLPAFDQFLADTPPTALAASSSAEGEYDYYIERLYVRPDKSFYRYIDFQVNVRSERAVNTYGEIELPSTRDFYLLSAVRIRSGQRTIELPERKPDGRRLFMVRDLKSGDSIRVRYYYYGGRERLPGTRFFFTYPFLAARPLFCRRAVFQLFYPSGMTMAVQSHNILSKTEKAAPGVNVLTAVALNVPALRNRKYDLPVYLRTPWIMAGNMTSPDDLARWFNSYWRDAILPSPYVRSKYAVKTAGIMNYHMKKAYAQVSRIPLEQGRLFDFGSVADLSLKQRLSVEEKTLLYAGILKNYGIRSFPIYVPHRNKTGHSHMPFSPFAFSSSLLLIPPQSFVSQEHIVDFAEPGLPFGVITFKNQGVTGLLFRRQVKPYTIPFQKNSGYLEAVYQIDLDRHSFSVRRRYYGVYARIRSVFAGQSRPQRIVQDYYRKVNDRLTPQSVHFSGLHEIGKPLTIETNGTCSKLDSGVVEKTRLREMFSLPPDGFSRDDLYPRYFTKTENTRIRVVITGAGSRPVRFRNVLRKFKTCRYSLSVKQEGGKIQVSVSFACRPFQAASSKLDDFFRYCAEIDELEKSIVL